MTPLVVDASVVAKWVHEHNERYLEHAERLRGLYEFGHISIVAPRLLRIEVLNAAARKWHWHATDLSALSVLLERLRFGFIEPTLADVARWAGEGLTAYDATYVSLAEGQHTVLVTDDERIGRIAPHLVRPLTTF